MKRPMKKIGKIGVSLPLRVSRSGGGLYLYIPKGICDVHGIEGGDQIEVKLEDHYTPVYKPKKEEEG